MKLKQILWSIVCATLSLIALSLNSAAATFTSEDLSIKILSELTNAFPKLDPTTRGIAAGLIAGDPNCTSALSQSTFQQNLETALKAAANLNWTKSPVTAAEVAKRISTTLYTPPLATPIDVQSLAKALDASLTGSLPRLNSAAAAREAGQLAAQCSTAVDQNSLAGQLDNALAHDSRLPLAGNLALRDRIVADTVLAIYPTATTQSWLTRPPPKANATGSPWQISLWTGARIDSPYSIVVSNGVGTLKPSRSSSDGYIEIELNSRYVTRNGTADDILIWPWAKHTIPGNGPNWMIPGDRMPDIDARMGYVFRNSSAPGSFDTSTVVGGSDLYGNTSVGFPFAQICGTNYSWKGQLSLEAAGGFATDKEHLNIHPNFFAGVGAQASFTAIGFGSTNYQGFWYGRAGEALVDEPALFPGTNTVHLNGLGEPEFDLHWVPSIGTVIIYPLNSWLSLQAGADAYFTSRPPSLWTLSIGVTLNVDKVFGALGKSSTGNEN